MVAAAGSRAPGQMVRPSVRVRRRRRQGGNELHLVIGVLAARACGLLRREQDVRERIENVVAGTRAEGTGEEKIIKEGKKKKKPVITTTRRT